MMNEGMHVCVVSSSLSSAEEVTSGGTYTCPHFPSPTFSAQKKETTGRRQFSLASFYASRLPKGEGMLIITSYNAITSYNLEHFFSKEKYDQHANIQSAEASHLEACVSRASGGCPST